MPLKFITREAGRDQVFCKHQVAPWCFYQGVDEFGVDVERLVGRNRPRRGGPNDDKGGQVGFRQLAEAEG